MDPDLIARRVVMSAFLYTELNSPVLSDADFDRSCQRVAERWQDVQPIRQWQLGSPENILTTSQHVKITRQSLDAAVAWYKYEFPKRPELVCRVDPGRWLAGPKEFAQVRYFTLLG